MHINMGDILYVGFFPFFFTQFVISSLLFCLFGFSKVTICASDAVVVNEGKFFIASVTSALLLEAIYTLYFQF